MEFPPASIDEHWMQKALDLAAQGRGLVSPNPVVGAVIVRDEKVVGEGFHQYDLKSTRRLSRSNKRETKRAAQRST